MWSQRKNPSQPLASVAAASRASRRASESSPKGATKIARRAATARRYPSRGLRGLELARRDEGATGEEAAHDGVGDEAGIDVVVRGGVVGSGDRHGTRVPDRRHANRNRTMVRVRRPAAQALPEDGEPAAARERVHAVLDRGLDLLVLLV